MSYSRRLYGFLVQLKTRGLPTTKSYFLRQHPTAQIAPNCSQLSVFGIPTCLKLQLENLKHQNNSSKHIEAPNSANDKLGEHQKGSSNKTECCFWNHSIRISGSACKSPELSKKRRTNPSQMNLIVVQDRALHPKKSQGGRFWPKPQMLAEMGFFSQKTYKD